MEKIQWGAFLDCGKLKSIALPEGIRIIDKCSFFGNGITEMFIPKSVSSIGSQAFESCTSLHSFSFEEGTQLRLLESSTFKDCEALQDISLPEGLRTI